MEHIIYQLEEDLAIITLNRPHVANGFHIPMCEEILETLTLAEENSSVRFILIKLNLSKPLLELVWLQMQEEFIS